MLDLNLIFNKEKIGKLLYLLTFLFLILINFIYFYLHLTSNIEVSSYAFNELFINYQAGFIRRGLLGEIAWQIDSIFSIKPIIFFGILFLVVFLSQVFIFFYLFKNYIDSKLIFILIFFSPSLLLFHIYSPDLYFIKDGIIKFAILFHAFIFYYFVIIKKQIKKYLDYLKFLIIPLLFVIILTHEYQVFSIPIHFLISFGINKNKKALKDIIRVYLPLIIPTFLVIIFFGNELQYENLSQILTKYDVTLNPHLGGGFIKYLGAFYKWHFFYFKYEDFVNLFASFLLGVFVIYFLFQFLIQNKILLFQNSYQKNYYIYFIPTLIPFFLTTDHGRNLSLVAFYLVAFYSTLNFNKNSINKLNEKINNSLFTKSSFLIFLIFYIFMWKLNQFAGFPYDNSPSIFQSSLFAEFSKLIKFVYAYIDLNIISLPEIKL
tara:strand:- start:967 stop:2262 length:1296 start_codon:yes stop_codon:yes gene_type:complete